MRIIFIFLLLILLFACTPYTRLSTFYPSTQPSIGEKTLYNTEFKVFSAGEFSYVYMQPGRFRIQSLDDDCDGNITYIRFYWWNNGQAKLNFNSSFIEANSQTIGLTPFDLLTGEKQTNNYIGKKKVTPDSILLLKEISEGEKSIRTSPRLVHDEANLLKLKLDRPIPCNIDTFSIQLSLSNLEGQNVTVEKYYFYPLKLRLLNR